MNRLRILGLLLLLLFSGCGPDIDDQGTDDEIVPPNKGTLEFRFIMPKYKIPADGIHRISLSFAYSVDSLYRGQFFQKVNVSDFQEAYTLFFRPDDYYFDAVITCSCGGDTCLNGDFPGGRFGMKHYFDKFSIDNQRLTIVETHFQ